MPSNDIPLAAPPGSASMPFNLPAAPTFDWENWFFGILASAAQPQSSGAYRLAPCPRVFVPELRALEQTLHPVQTALLAPSPECPQRPEPVNEPGEGVERAPAGLAAAGLSPSLAEPPASAYEQAELLSLDFNAEALCHAVRVAAALQLTAAAREGLTPPLSTKTLDACVQALNDAQAPYYTRYLLVRNVLQHPEHFEAYRARLQTPDIKLHRGNSQHHRFDALERHFPGGHQLVDIGCGKAHYLKVLAKRYRRATGFDADPYARAMSTQALQRAGLAHVRVFGAFDLECYVPDRAHVLMTEVLEHLPPERACELLRHLSQQNAEKMVFTVPNRDFNRHYGMPPGDFRHWDHQWEPNAREFEDFMRAHLDTKKWSLSFEKVGDKVRGVASGHLCIARRTPAPTARKAMPRAWLEGVLR